MSFDYHFKMQLAAPRAVVFERLLRIEHLSRWFCGWCRIEPKVGGTFKFGGETCIIPPEGRAWESIRRVRGIGAARPLVHGRRTERNRSGRPPPWRRLLVRMIRRAGRHPRVETRAANRLAVAARIGAARFGFRLRGKGERHGDLLLHDRVRRKPGIRNRPSARAMVRPPRLPQELR